MIKKLFSFIAVSTFTVLSVFGEVLVYDGAPVLSDSSPYKYSTAISATSGGTGSSPTNGLVGFTHANTWASGTTRIWVSAQTNALAFPSSFASASPAIMAVGGSFQMQPDGSAAPNGDVLRTTCRRFTAALPTSGYLYFRCLLRLPATPQTLYKSHYAGAGFSITNTGNVTSLPTSGTIFFAFKENAAGDDASLVLRLGSTDYTLVSEADLADKTYLCVAKIGVNAFASGVETVQAYAIPVDEYTPAAATAWSTTINTTTANLIGDTSLSYLNIFGDYLNNNASFRVDEIALATELSDVVAVDSTVPMLVAYPAESIAFTSATATGTLSVVGTPDPTVSVLLGTTEGVFTTTNSLGTQSAAGALAYNFSGLFADTTYYYAFLASNSSTNVLSNIVSFRTAGAPVFGEVATSNVANTVYARAELTDVGFGSVTLSCWFGTSADALAQTNSWTGLAAAPCTNECAVADLVYGQTYYYAFRAQVDEEGRDPIVVWSATNSISISGTNTWTGAGADTAWTTAANWGLNAVPTVFLDALFTNKAPVLVTATAADVLAASNLTLNAENTTTTFDLGGATLGLRTWNVGMLKGGVVNVISNANLDVAGRVSLGNNGLNYNRIDLGRNTSLKANNLFVNYGSFNGFVVNSGAVVDVTAAAQINVTSYSSYLHVKTGGVMTAGSIYITSQWNSFVVDGGVVTNKGALTVNPRDSKANGLSYAEIKNGGYLYQMGNIEAASYVNGWFNILNGATVDAFGSVTVGSHGETANTYAKLNVSNATFHVAGSVSVPALYCDSWASLNLYQDDAAPTTTMTVGGNVVVGNGGPTAGAVGCNDSLRVYGGALAVTGLLRLGGSYAAGTNNSLVIARDSASVSAATLVVTNASVLNFTVPASGFKQVPVRISGTALIDATTKLIVDASAFTGTGDQILLSAGTLAADSIPATNIVLTGKGKIVQTDGEIIFRAGNGGFVIRICDNDVAVPYLWITNNLAAADRASDAAISNALVTAGANGLNRWESYALGLDPNKADSVVLCDAKQDASAASATLFARNVVATSNDAFTVSYVLEGSNDGASWTDNVLVSPTNAFAVALPNPYLFYRVRTDIVLK